MNDKFKMLTMVESSDLFSGPTRQFGPDPEYPSDSISFDRLAIVNGIATLLYQEYHGGARTTMRHKGRCEIVGDDLIIRGPLIPIDEYYAWRAVTQEELSGAARHPTMHADIRWAGIASRVTSPLVECVTDTLFGAQC